MTSQQTGPIDLAPETEGFTPRNRPKRLREDPPAAGRYVVGFLVAAPACVFAGFLALAAIPGTSGLRLGVSVLSGTFVGIMVFMAVLIRNPKGSAPSLGEH